VAVKIEEDLARFLDQLPNKSEFIRQAILAQFGTACPLCSGSGQVPAAIGAHYAPILNRFGTRACAKCQRVEMIPKDLSGVEDLDRPRWEQFFHGGPFFCARCFEKAEECGECGWHLSPDQLVEHARTAH
jgi:hypothetical protein